MTNNVVDMKEWVKKHKGITLREAYDRQLVEMLDEAFEDIQRHLAKTQPSPAWHIIRQYIDEDQRDS